MTTGADVITGTAADDTINALIGTNSVNGNNQDTLSSIDTVDGANGTDTLTVQHSASTANAPTIANVENIIYTEYDTTNKGFNLSNVTGLESFTNKGSIGTLTLNAVDSIVDLTLQNVNAQTTAVNYNAAAVAGLADTQKLTLNNASNNATIDMNSANIETLAITSTGSANKVALKDVDKIGKLTVAGDQDLTAGFTTTAVAALKTVDASKATGNLTLDLATNVAASKMSVTTGTGDDTVTFANMTKDDSFDMGDGNDTLVLNAFTSPATVNPTLTGVENIVFSGQTANATLKASNVDKLESITITSTGGANTNTIIKAAATAKTINFDTMNGATTAATYENVTFALAKATGTSDELTLNFQNTNANGLHVNIADDTKMTEGTVTANGIETINIKTADMGADNNSTKNDSGVVITTLTDDKMQTLNIDSDTLVTITSDLGATLNTVSATDATAGVVLDFTSTADSGHTTFSDTTLTINTGAGADTLNNLFKTTAAVHTATINTGAGADTITLGGNVGDGAGSVDTLTIDAGAGNDKVDVSASTTTAAKATMSVTLGDGVDTIVLNGANTQTGVTVTDFATGSGGDKIDFKTSAATGVASPVKYVETAGSHTVNEGMVVYTGNDAASLSTANVATALAGAGTGVVGDTTAGHKAYIIASDGTDTGVYEFIETGGAAITAGELTQIATLTGVDDASALSVDNFTDFLA